MLARFDIASLSPISAFLRDCIAPDIIIWASVSCAWFAVAPYPWEEAVVFLRIL